MLKVRHKGKNETLLENLNSQDLYISESSIFQKNVVQNTI